MGCWDRSRLERVLTNLLSNAIKYSPDGEPIRVHVGAIRRDESDWVMVRVIDEGIGIPRGEHERIFEWFVRAPNALATEIEGIGIGLAGVRKIVEMHGGDVGVLSEPGHGATFTVRLPLGDGYLMTMQTSSVPAQGCLATGASAEP